MVDTHNLWLAPIAWRSAPTLRMPLPSFLISLLADGADRVGLAVMAPGLIQSLSQGPLPVLSAWVEVGGIAPSLCLKAPPPQPIST